MKSYLLVFAASLVVSTALTWVVREVSKRFGILPEPDSHHIHRQPISRLGGVAIFLTFCCSLFLLYLGSRFGFLPSPAGRDPLKILLPAVLLFATGLFDDLRALRARTKLLVQICGALWLCWNGLCFPEFDLQISGLSFGHVLSIGMTVCWVVWVCNGINFIDGLDGLAAGTSVLLTVPIFVVALLTGKVIVAMAAIALAGAVLGFLSFNYNPATIFLGDSGSLFLGFVLSGLVLAEAKNGGASLRSLVIPLIAFALPLTDTVVTFLRRILSGRALFDPDRKHIHHKLLDMGLSHRQAVGILYGVSASSVGLSLLFLSPRFGRGSVAVGGVSLLIAFLGIQRLGYNEFREISDIGKTLQRHARAFVFNATVWKTVARLSTVRNPMQLTELLETCLRPGFCGFELALSSRFSKTKLRGIPKSCMIRRFWGPTNLRTARLSIDLATRNSGPIGSLRVYPDWNVPLPVDVEILMEEIGGGLSLALARILQSASGELTKIPAFERADSTEIDKSRDTVGPAAVAGD